MKYTNAPLYERVTGHYIYVYGILSFVKTNVFTSVHNVHICGTDNASAVYEFFHSVKSSRGRPSIE